MFNITRKLILIALLVGIAVWVVVINGSPTTVFLPALPPKEVTANTGVVILVVFSLGFLAAAVFGVFLGVRAYMRERQLRSKEKRTQDFYAGMLKARSEQALDDWERARNSWERIIRKDPSDVIARVELSKVLEGVGEHREALRTIDNARSSDSDNLEVLLRAAELNLRLGNKTAAIDNLALVLYHHPTAKAARLARDLSEQLGRIQDALEYQSQLERLAPPNDDDRAAAQRLEFGRLTEEYSEDQTALVAQLRSFQKRNQDFLPALERLAELELEAGRFEEAAQLYIRAAKTADPRFWEKVASIWHEQGKPQKAVAALRAAVKDSSGETRLETSLSLVKLLLNLDMLEDADEVFKQLTEELEAHKGASDKLRLHYLALKGFYLNRKQEYKRAAEVWQSLAKNGELELLSSSEPKASALPSPQLSTP